MNIIYFEGPITREEINSRWLEEKDLNPRREYMPRRTFAKTIDAIRKEFHVDVKVDQYNSYTYSIERENIEGISINNPLTPLGVLKRQMKLWEDETVPQQMFRIDAAPEVVERLRRFPICPEQKVYSEDKETGIVTFAYYMRPTWDWYEKVRSLGGFVRVVHPYWLADLMRRDALSVANMYKDAQDENLEFHLINPYDCRLIHHKGGCLYLNISESLFDALVEGLIPEVNVFVNPQNIWHLLQMDIEKTDRLLDADGCALPVQYETIHFKAGADTFAPEALVEIKKIEVFELTDKDGKQRRYVTDALDNVLKDDYGDNLSPEFDEEGNCINGKLWYEDTVTFTLGKVIEVWEMEEN